MVSCGVFTLLWNCVGVCYPERKSKTGMQHRIECIGVHDHDLSDVHEQRECVCVFHADGSHCTYNTKQKPCRQYNDCITYVDEFMVVTLLQIVKDRSVVKVCQVGHILCLLIFWWIDLCDQIFLEIFGLIEFFLFCLVFVCVFRQSQRAICHRFADFEILTSRV